jgi:hypothetical protein
VRGDRGVDLGGRDVGQASDLGNGRNRRLALAGAAGDEAVGLDQVQSESADQILRALGGSVVARPRGGVRFRRSP